MKSKPPLKQQRWKPGNVYAVPLCDGSFGIVQAVSKSAGVDIALSDERTHALDKVSEAFDQKRIVALLSTGQGVLNGGHWALIRHEPLWVEPAAFANQQIMARGSLVGTETHSSPVLEGFLNAYHGLVPWNAYNNKDWHDKLLAPGVQRPPTAWMLNAAELLLLEQEAAKSAS